jgi:hypothetical protein
MPARGKLTLELIESPQPERSRARSSGAAVKLFATRADGTRVSNVDRTRPSSTGPVTAPRVGSPTVPRSPNVTARVPGGDFPSELGTAVLELTSEQSSQIRKLLIAMRLGRAMANDVRTGIFALLSGRQRRMLDAAYFIISVRV